MSDTTAFPCTTAEIAVAKAASVDDPSDPGAVVDGGRAGQRPQAASLGGALTACESPVRSLSAGSTTDCEPGGPVLTLRGGYTVSMCYEAQRGEVGDAKDWGLDSSQSGLLYFFERNNAEVLIKVLDGCAVNGHRRVFVAPVTDLAFNLYVESHNGRRWTHTNRLGQTADMATDVSAFDCDNDDAITVAVDAASAEEGDAVEFTVTLSAPAAGDTVLGWSTSAATATAGADFTAVTAERLSISAGETTGTLRDDR